MSRRLARHPTAVATPAPQPARPIDRPCRDCALIPAQPGTGGRCELCWALAAHRGHWFRSGLERNAFPHQTRRGQASRRYERAAEQ